MMSRMAPRVARTSFVSAAGGYWKCIPRTVPFLRLKATFACAITGFNPCCSNSRWQNLRAKKPRLSSCRSMSMTNAPRSLVSVKIISGGPRSSSCSRRLALPAQVRAQVALGQQSLELIDAAVPGPFEVFEPESDRVVSLVQLPRALARVPLRLKRRQDAEDFREIGAVVALVGSRPLGERDLAAGDRLLHDLGDLADTIVLVVASHVERLPAHRLPRRGQDGEERAGDVLDVNDGPPGRTVALEQDLAGGERPGYEVVEHDVEAEPRRNAIGGGAAQEGGCEGFVGEPGDVALGEHLGFAVSRDRVELGVLAHRRVSGSSVVAAGRGEHEAAYPDFLGERGEADRGAVVDVEGELRVEIAEGIVGERREVRDRIDPLEIPGFERAHVLRDRPDGVGPGAEGRSPVEVCVDADHLVARGDHHRRHHGADVSPASRDQDLQARPLAAVVTIALEFAQVCSPSQTSEFVRKKTDDLHWTAGVHAGSRTGVRFSACNR